jgi:hypothetical protein
MEKLKELCYIHKGKDEWNKNREKKFGWMRNSGLSKIKILDCVILGI